MSTSIYTSEQQPTNKKIYTRECPSCSIVIEHDSKTMRDHYQKHKISCDTCKNEKTNKHTKEVAIKEKNFTRLCHAARHDEKKFDIEIPYKTKVKRKPATKKAATI